MRPVQKRVLAEDLINNYRVSASRACDVVLLHRSAWTIAPLLKSKSYRDSTIVGAIKRYAPPTDGNNPTKYAQHIATSTGLPDTAVIKNLNDSELLNVVKQIQKEEGYSSPINKTYTPNQKGNPTWVDSLFRVFIDSTQYNKTR